MVIGTLAFAWYSKEGLGGWALTAQNITITHQRLVYQRHL